MLRTTKKLLRQITVIVVMLSKPISAEVLESRQFKADKTSVSVKKISCEASGSRSIIRISGLIGPDATFLLRQSLADIPNIASGNCSFQTTEHSEQRLPQHTVFLTSDGGYAKDGMSLGNYLREIGAVTVAIDTCSSACAFAYLGGIRRDLEGELLFHMPYTIQGDTTVCQNKTEHIRTYYRSMLGSSLGDMLYDRTRLYCSASDGWTISDQATARLYGLETIKQWEERSFDLSGALRAGYSHCQIAVKLASDSGFDLEGASEAGYSCKEISEHLSKPIGWRE